MTSGLPAFISPLTRLMVALHQNVVKQETSEIFTFLERHVLGHLHELFFDDAEKLQHFSTQGTPGVVTTGGTLANLTALWCARNLCFQAEENFEGIQKEGIANAFKKHQNSRGLILGSRFMHYSIEKAADFLGLGGNNVIQLPCNERGQLHCEALKEALLQARKEAARVVAVVGIAGSTEIGSVDDLEAIADICQDEGVFFHVDAAWGGPLLFSEHHRHLLKGIERADSVTLDGHKQLFLPVGTGVLLFRRPKLAAHIEKEAHYIIRKDSWDLGRFGLEGSRPANALYLHAALHIFGKEGFAFLMERNVELCLQFHQHLLSSLAFEVPFPPTMNILSYRYIPSRLRHKSPGFPTGKAAFSKEENNHIDTVNIALQTWQRKQGQSFVSRTVLQTPGGNHATYLRCILANPQTSFSDLETMLRTQEEKGRELEKNL
jgi:glutamate decarboxylase